MDNTYWVYILASGFRGTLYVGVTNSLERRMAEHKAKLIKGFTAEHNVHRLVYFRGFGEVTEAIHFEKQLKRWRRDWKIRLIEEANHRWADLYLDLMALPPMHPDIAAAIEENTNNRCHPGFAERRPGPTSVDLSEGATASMPHTSGAVDAYGSRSLRYRAKPG